MQALPPRPAALSEHHAGAAAQPSSEVLHSGRFVLIDPEWRIRAYYDGTELDLEQVVRDVRSLLR